MFKRSKSSSNSKIESSSSSINNSSTGSTTKTVASRKFPFFKSRINGLNSEVAVKNEESDYNSELGSDAGGNDPKIQSVVDMKIDVVFEGHESPRASTNRNSYKEHPHIVLPNPSSVAETPTRRKRSSTDPIDRLRSPSSQSNNSHASDKLSSIAIDPNDSSIGPTKDTSGNRRLFQRMFPRHHFRGETLIKTFICAIEKDIILQGKMFLTSKSVCFYTNVLNRSFNLSIPYIDITLIEKRKTLGFVPNAIRITVGDESHSFISFTKRDLAFSLMSEFLEISKRQDEIPYTIYKDLSDSTRITRMPSTIRESVFGHSQIFEEYLPDDLNRQACPCESHYSMIVLDLDVSMTHSELFDDFFGDFHKIWTIVHKKTETNGLFIDNWRKDKNDVWKRKLAYSPMIKLPNLGGSSVFCQELQTLTCNNKNSIVIESNMSVQIVAYEEGYTLKTRYCLNSKGQRSSRLLMTAEVNFTKRFISKSKIENILFSWITLFASNLNQEIQKISSDESNKMEKENQSNSVQVETTESEVPFLLGNALPQVENKGKNESLALKVKRRVVVFWIMLAIMVLLAGVYIGYLTSTPVKQINHAQLSMYIKQHENLESDLWDEFKGLNMNIDALMHGLTKMERTTIKYKRAGVADESSSSATPYLTDSDKDLVVETETMILRHHDRPNFLQGIASGEDDEEFLYSYSSQDNNPANLLKKSPSIGRLNRFPIHHSPAMTRKSSLSSLRIKKSSSQLYLHRVSKSKHDINDANETTGLLAKSPLEIVHEHISFKKHNSRSTILIILLIFAIFFILFTFIIFSVQPLTCINNPTVLNIDGQPKYFAFNMSLEAGNYNIVGITIEDADLDVLASAGLPDITSDVPATSEELLGHVKKLVQPAYFPALTRSNSTISVNITEPLNTLGKLIYLTVPYTLHIRGSVLYSTVTSAVQYSIPICSIYWVEDPNKIKRRPCHK